MPHFRHNGTAYKEVVVAARASGAVLQNIVAKWRWTDGAWRKYFGAGGGGSGPAPLVAHIDPDMISKHGGSNSTITSSIAGSATGGTAPYTHHWEIIDGPVFLISSPSNPTAVFRTVRSGAMEGSADVRESTALYTVTDALGATAVQMAYVTHQHGGVIE